MYKIHSITYFFKKSKDLIKSKRNTSGCPTGSRYSTEIH